MPPIVADVRIVYVQNVAEMMQSFAVLEMQLQKKVRQIQHPK